jgi:hypothetical protein
LIAPRSVPSRFRVKAQADRGGSADERIAVFTGITGQSAKGRVQWVYSTPSPARYQRRRVQQQIAQTPNPPGMTVRF